MGRTSTRRQRGIDTATEQIAHIWRRCSFGTHHEQVAKWRTSDPQDLITALVENTTFWALDEASLFDDYPGDEDNERTVLLTMLDQMMSLDNPLHERMAWYWSTHFTTNVQAEARLAWQQHHLFRRHAFGNFRDLARAITTDPAMLLYLDGAGSNGDAPNENYAREFLELFTLGRNAGYTETDVRAAARIFSGWHVDWETAAVRFEPDTHYERPVTFMGERRRWSLDDFIDYICGQPQCHEHVVTRMYHHFVGPDLSAARRNELAKVFVDNDLEILPLIAAMLRGDDFLAAIHSRARQPLEWVLGAIQALGFETATAVDLQIWQLENLGQTPFRPPNVAGWPLDDRWSGTSQIVGRTSLLLEWELAENTIDNVAPTVAAVLERCGIYAPSPSTLAALKRIERDFSEFDYRLELLFVTALTSPEFTLL
jgi:uncharacterized protein (DUF1800 family)